VDHPLRTLLYELFLEPFLRRIKRPFERLFALWHLFSVLLVSLLTLSTHLMWAQETPPPKDTPVLFFYRAPQLASVWETETHGRPVPLMPLSFETSKGQARSRVRVPPLATSYYRTPINNRTLLELQPPVGTAEPPGKAKYSPRSASSDWATPFYGKLASPPVHRSNDLQYLIPGARPMILRISQQAQAHPHITRVLKLFSPEF
jgi:hypothetical protein